MKKYSVVLVAALCMLHSFAFSQKTKSVAKPKVTAKTSANHASTPAVKKPVIKDTLAYNIQTTINELNSYIRDENQPIQVLLGSFLETTTWGNSYSSVIKIPTSVENTFLRGYVDRYEGVEHWEWKSVLVRSTKDQLPASTFTSLKSKIDSIITAMPEVKESDKKNSVSRIIVNENVSNAQYRYLYKTDEVTIQVDFVKSITQAEQQTIDSLVKLYRPGLSNASTAKDASYKFTSALSSEGFSQEKREAIFADELKVVADKDIKAAFYMLMDASYLNSKNLEAKLTEDQRSEIIKIAHNVVNEYNAKWNPVIPPSTNQGTNWNQQQNQQQPQGRTVRCSVCEGTGQYEKVTYSHTYDGIYNKITTNVTKWVVCEFCGGTGWVVKYKNKKH